MQNTAAISIEDPLPDDAAEIFFVQRQTWHENYLNDLSHEEIEKRFADAPARIEQIKNTIETNFDHTFFVARTEGKIVGFVSVLKKPHHEIKSLYVLSTHHRIGIGSQLLKRAMNWLGHRKTVVIETDNLAREFYEKNKFQYIRTLPEQTHDGFELFEMRWNPPMIETPTPDDAAEIFFVQRQTWHESYLNQVSHEDIERRFADAPTRIEQLRQKITDPEHHQFFIARYEGKIIAFVSLSRSPHPEIESLYALQEFHGWGLGRKLMEKSLAWFGNSEKIFMETHDDSIQKFYEKFGFKYVGPVENREGFSKNMRQLVLDRTKN